MKVVDMTLGDLMTASVKTVASDITLQEAAQLMADARFSCLVVQQDGHPVGILTERDLVRFLHDQVALSRLINEVMSTPVVTARVGDTFRDGLLLMHQYALRHLVLVDHSNVVCGIVSESDLRSHLGLDVIGKVKNLQAAMDRSTPSMPPETSLSHALERMIFERWDYVVVAEGEQALGIITERDIPGLLTARADAEALTLQQVMSFPVKTIRHDASLFDAVKQMTESRMRHLVVVDEEEKFVGAISQHGLLERIGLEFIGDSMHELETLRAERVAAERALQERQEVYSTIVNQAADSIVLIDSETLGFAEFNTVAHESLGYSREEFKVMTLLDLQAEMPPSQVRQRVQKTVADGSSYLFEIPHRRKDGSVRLTRVSSRPVTIRGKIYLSAIWTDITEHRRAESALRKSEAHFRSLFEQAAVGMSIVSPEAKWLQVNQRLCDILGYTREELLSLNFQDITPPELVGSDKERVRQLLAGKVQADSWEKQYIRKDRRLIWVRITTSLARTEDGRPDYFVTITEDITAQREISEGLRRSEQKLRGLYELSPLGIALTDMQGHYIDFNEAFTRICGYPEAEIKQLDYWTLTPEKYAEAEVEQLECLEQNGCYGPYEKAYRRKDGTLVPIRLNGMLVTGEDEQHYIWSIVEDISERVAAEEQINLAASVFSEASEGIMITDAAGVILKVNHAFTTITGYQAEEALGNTPRMLKSGRHDLAFYTKLWNQLVQTEHWVGELWNRRKGGEEYAEQLSISAVKDAAGKTTHYVGIFTDITEHKRQQEQIERLAYYDALTRLPNRVLLADRMRQAIAHADRSKRMFAVCYLDLDGFKPINDRFGHKAGDSVLVEIAKRLQDFVRSEDTVARLGGDEFVLLLTGLGREEESEPILARLLEIVTRPCALSENVKVSVSASIGVTFYPTDHNDSDVLLRHADQAMYQAKQLGRNRMHPFDPIYDQQARMLRELKTKVRGGLGRSEFLLYWQPKIDLVRGHVVGAEALIRWKQEDASILLPGSFLPTLENDDLIIEIGDFVIQEGISTLSRWQALGMDLSVSINIAARQMLSPDFIGKLHAVLAGRADIAARLELEILETTALEDLDKVKRLIDECRALGVSTALDDFGTGYSSMTYFRHLPVDTVKVDQSFVRDMLTNTDDLAIVEGILGLTKAFGKTAVAEGVEFLEHLPTLQRMGCHIAQGYAIGYPMPEQEFLRWVKDFKPDFAWTHKA